MNAKKLTIEELCKAQDRQADLFALLSNRIGNKRTWSVEMQLCNCFAGDDEQHASVSVYIANPEGGHGKAFRVTFADWALTTFPEMREELNRYLDEIFPEQRPSQTR